MQIPPSLPLKKPKTFMLVGIGLLILGAFYLLGLLMNIAYAVIPALQPLNPLSKLIAEDSTYAVLHYINLASGGLVGLIAIVGGIGLVKSKNWGRTLGIAWAAMTILTAPYGWWIAKKYVEPVTMAQMQSQMGSGNAPAGFAEGMATFITIMGVVFSVLWIAFCIAVIYFLARPKMKAWCALQEGQKAS